jgi:hypothetical protein
MSIETTDIKIKKQPKQFDTLKQRFGIDEEEERKLDREEHIARDETMIQLRTELAELNRHFKAHLRGRVLELVLEKDWKDFGLIKKGDSAPVWDSSEYNKDPIAYNKKFEDYVQRYVDPKFGGNKQKWNLRQQYARTIAKDRIKLRNLINYAKKINEELTLKDLEV